MVQETSGREISTGEFGERNDTRNLGERNDGEAKGIEELGNGTCTDKWYKKN